MDIAKNRREPVLAPQYVPDMLSNVVYFGDLRMQVRRSLDPLGETTLVTVNECKLLF
jgi:hypothetical protein